MKTKVRVQVFVKVKTKVQEANQVRDNVKTKLQDTNKVQDSDDGGNATNANPKEFCQVLLLLPEAQREALVLDAPPGLAKRALQLLSSQPNYADLGKPAKQLLPLFSKRLRATPPPPTRAKG